MRRSARNARRARSARKECPMRRLAASADRSYGFVPRPGADFRRRSDRPHERWTSLSITEAEIAELADFIDKGRDAWINGHFDDRGPMQAEDATIFGPFGGVAPKGVAPRVRPDVQRKIAGRFGGVRLGSSWTDWPRILSPDRQSWRRA